jgi:hypothetical protein
LDDVRSGVKGKGHPFLLKNELVRRLLRLHGRNTNLLTFYGQLDPKAPLEFFLVYFGGHLIKAIKGGNNQFQHNNTASNLSLGNENFTKRNNCDPNQFSHKFWW